MFEKMAANFMSKPKEALSTAQQTLNNCQQNLQLLQVSLQQSFIEGRAVMETRLQALGEPGSPFSSRERLQEILAHDEDKEDEYVDIVGANATTTHKSTFFKPAKNSTTKVVMITIVWILMLGSGIKLHQLFLIMSILLFTSTLDANVVIGFVAAGLLHLLRGMWGQDSDIDDHDEFYGYYGDGDTASFTVELGGRKFTWQEKRSAF